MLSELDDLVELGTTGVRLPVIGIGTGPDTTAEVLRAAAGTGDVLVDTAESYGNEELLGVALALVRPRVFLATKVSPQNLRFIDVLRAADRSLKRLRTDYIDLYQVHRSNPLIPLEETMAAMEHLVDSGKVRFIGVSNFSKRQIIRARAALAKHPIVSNQMPLSLLNRSAEVSMIPFCKLTGTTLIASSPLRGGLGRIRARDPRSLLARLAAEYGKTEAQIALNWVIGHPHVLAIPRSSSVQHTMENRAAAGWRLSAQSRQSLERAVHYRYRTGAEIALRHLVHQALWLWRNWRAV